MNYLQLLSVWWKSLEVKLNICYIMYNIFTICTVLRLIGWKFPASPTNTLTQQVTRQSSTRKSKKGSTFHCLYHMTKHHVAPHTIKRWEEENHSCCSNIIWWWRHTFGLTFCQINSRGYVLIWEPQTQCHLCLLIHHHIISISPAASVLSWIKGVLLRQRPVLAFTARPQEKNKVSYLAK